MSNASCYNRSAIWVEVRLNSSKPSFIGIGAQKCASTWLYRVLEEHPEVRVSDVKELDFFSFHFNHGYQWYEKHFANGQQHKACGEISPSYFCEQGVPRRVFNYDPNLKIIVCFRDPVDRLLSNHRHEVREGHFSLENNSLQVGLANNPMYVEQGKYATHLKNWYQFFPKDQIFIIFMEEIETDPFGVARKLYSFIDVDSSFQPRSGDKKYNVSHANRSLYLRRVKDMAYDASQVPGFGWMWGLLDALGLKSVYRKINRMPSPAVIPQPPEELIASLRQQYEPEIRELSKLIGRSLDAWLC